MFLAKGLSEMLLLNGEEEEATMKGGHEAVVAELCGITSVLYMKYQTGTTMLL